MRKSITFIFAFIIAYLLLSEEIKTNDFGIKFSGYVKSDFFYDSRQTVNLREGHFLLYPTPKFLDANSADINATSSLNFLSIQSRLTGNISAPDAFGAKVNGVIEADFFGNESAAFIDANGFRLRHAFAKLNWGDDELLLGQYWHPLFIPTCFSEVISFNTGAPFQPFSRNPQIRYLHRFSDISFTGALVEQRDFTSPAGSSSLRNSSLPEIQGLLQYETKSLAGNNIFLAGFGGGYKVIKPQLNTEKSGKKYISDETLGGFNTNAFFKIDFKSFSFKCQAIYGQNLYDMTMLGGYAISEILDSTKNSVRYTAVNTFSTWSEIILNHINLQFSIWAGYTENLGSNDKIMIYSNKVGGTDVTLRGTSIDNLTAIKYIYRFSPRIVLTSAKLSFALEGEYTTASYATKDSNGILNRDNYGKITQSENVSNFRILFSTILKF